MPVGALSDTLGGCWGEHIWQSRCMISKTNDLMNGTSVEFQTARIGQM